MAVHGFDYPGSKSNEDHARRQEIFDIIAPCVMSQADIDIVKQSPMTVRQLWLETLSMTQKGMLVTKLRKVVKDVVREYFPSRGGLPRPSYAKAEGLAPSTTILDRTLQYLFSLELAVIETHFFLQVEKS